MSSTKRSAVYPRTIIKRGKHFVWVKWWDGEKYSALFERLGRENVIALVGFERRGRHGHSFKDPSLDQVPDAVQTTVENEGFTIAEPASSAGGGE